MIRTCRCLSEAAWKCAHIPEDDLNMEVVLIKPGVGALVGKGRPCSALSAGDGRSAR